MNNMNNNNINYFNSNNNNLKRNLKFNNKINNIFNKVNNNVMNNFQDNMDNNIFNSISSNEYFVFSLDNSKLYYSDKNKDNNIPNFSILFDFERQCIYGNETNNNNSNNLTQSLQTINLRTQNIFNNNFKLSGKSQFNVKCFELYEIMIENN